MLLIISAKCRIFQILSMIEEASGTRLYESKKEAAQKTIEKKDMKLKEIDSVICFKNSRVTQSSGVDGFDKCWKTKKKINKKLFHWSRLYKAKLFWSYSVLPRELIFTFFSSLFKTFAKLFGTVSLSDSASCRCYRVSVSSTGWLFDNESPTSCRSMYKLLPSGHVFLVLRLTCHSCQISSMTTQLYILGVSE